MIDRLVTAAPALIVAAAALTFAIWAISWSLRDIGRRDAHQQASLREIENYANQHGKEKPQP